VVSGQIAPESNELAIWHKAVTKYVPNITSQQNPYLLIPKRNFMGDAIYHLLKYHLKSTVFFHSRNSEIVLLR
jgi:hypothetical protein